MRTILAISAVLIAATAIAIWIAVQRQPGNPVAPPVATVVERAPKVIPIREPMPSEPAPVPARPSAAPETVAPPSTPIRPAAAASAPPPRAPEPLRDPTARAALSFVGADPDADAYWYGAINDLSLSAHERQDLIEDLNEDGLSDPRRPTEADLPLIVNRLLLIEQVAPFAVDPVNADAFQEAYKDLATMFARLTAR